MTQIGLEEALRTRFHPDHLVIEDDGPLHVGHLGAQGGGHFSVLIVSNDFKGLTPVDRHRQIYDAVQMGKNPLIHALAITALTPEEFRLRQK